MLVRFRAPIHKPTGNTTFDSFLRRLSQLPPKSKLLQTLQMVATQSKPKRPTCPSCSKPLRVCLCTRMRHPALENSVAVTILQHSLEKKHPLNSTRIAKLGLKNLTVVDVSDVLFSARFEIRLLEPESVMGLVDNAVGGRDIDESCIFEGIQKGASNGDGESCMGRYLQEESAPVGSLLSSSREAIISASIDRFGVISSLEHPWNNNIQWKKPSFSKILASSVAYDVLAKGFSVKKFQKRQVHGSLEMEDYEEFDLLVPSGTVLLFPTNEAVSVDDLREKEFEVKNIIVLDGTWAKATRMYNENPWLKLLPHLKVNLEKMSLYGEVRHQPKAGFLSTIESIVYTLRAVGDNPEGVDDLLNVFESMVGDQRRCKDERLGKAS